ncbi:hypothetical protein QW060_22990 [Myroides ceti]|uniref:Uncharacterized protein n=1 Tax=Paenimyroides ceti TaxID=395087 RepID=A0ABT8CPC2_9FLAO|nr:hypothetical protein [Paenimyroides ceti]MDN3705606.1 hypothetical protein [Paenimyroides ceti]MDN3709810.1 hypothetical protein [Paenimyroides ceti]
MEYQTEEVYDFYEKPTLEDNVKSCLEDGLALTTTGAAAGIAVAKLTGQSKTLGAVAGLSVSLLSYAIIKLINKKK